MSMVLCSATVRIRILRNMHVTQIDWTTEVESPKTIHSTQRLKWLAAPKCICFPRNSVAHWAQIANRFTILRHTCHKQKQQQQQQRLNIEIIPYTHGTRLVLSCRRSAAPCVLIHDDGAPKINNAPKGVESICVFMSADRIEEPCQAEADEITHKSTNSFTTNDTSPEEWSV